MFRLLYKIQHESARCRVGETKILQKYLFSSKIYLFQISDNYRLVNSELRKNKNYMGYITANSLGKLKIKLKCIIANIIFFTFFDSILLVE